MSIFNKLLKNRQNSAPSPNEQKPTTPWDNMDEEVPFAGNTIREDNNLAKPSSEQMVQEATPLTELSPEQSAEILRQTQIDGDIYINPVGKEFTLTPEVLEENGLAPRHTFQMQNYNISLSDIFEIPHHDAVIAYIEAPNGEIKARSYYRSESTGLWRFCPDYGRNDGINMWFGKGFSEESLTLPFQFQKHLNSISEGNNAEPKPLFCFFGAAKRYASSRDYNLKKMSGATLPGDYPQEVSHRSSFEFPIELPPEKLDITGEKAPNFQKEISSYKTHSETYGDYEVHLFPS